MSVVYRERDRERFDDSRTSVSSARRGGDNVKVTRYVVREDDNRSSYGRDRHDDTRSNFGRDRYDRSSDRVEETRIIRKEREVEEPVRDYRRDEPAGYSREEITIRRDRDDESHRDNYYRRPAESTEDREIIIRRTTERDDSRDNVAVSRYDDRRDTRYDDYQVVNHRPSFGGDRDRDVQRYVRTAEYYSPPPSAPQPQTIIIRQEPIVIRERVRDDDYALIKRSEAEEERSVVRRDRDPPPRDEEYFYEKKVRERIPDEDDRRSERRLTRREVSPHDSVSQVGRRDYSSDDSMVYVRKETREDYDSDASSPHRKRDVAAGLIAGVGAAELLRNHKKKEGKETSHGIGRIGRDLGAGAIGAVAAEGIRRARSEYRSRSRRRRSDSGSRSRGDRRSRRGSRERSRSRSTSHSKMKTLGGIGLAAAALAAGAAIASKRNKGNESPRGRHSSRSRSRRRSSRSESLESLENDPTADDARNPKHRNVRIAGAGAVGAAAAALIERARSRSRARNGERERSKSRIRQGIPIAATALGSAALAGLYEKNKAKREAQEIKREEHRARSRSRSRARSEAYYDGPRQGGFSDPNLIEYGAGPMYGNNFGPDYYGRPQPQENYYNNATRDMVPAAETSSAYGDRQQRERSLTPDDRRGHRSRDPSHVNAEAAAAAAAGAGAAATAEADRKRERKERRRRDGRSREQSYNRDPYHGRDPYEDANYPMQGGFNPTPSPGAADPYATQTGFYPQTSQFPPPPGSVPQAYGAQQQPMPAAANTNTYGPQNFPPPPANPPPQPGTTFDPYTPGQNPYTPHQRGADENVSAEYPASAPTNQHHNTTVGVNQARAMSPPPINVSPPSPPLNGDGSARSSMPNLTVPSQTHVPPGEEGLSNQTSTPESSAATSAPEKKVSFAAKPDVHTATSSNTRTVSESEASSPDVNRHRRRHGDERRGYEAGDDFSDDTPLEDHRRRSHGLESSRSMPGQEDNRERDRSDRDRDRERRRNSRRERTDRESGRDRDRDKGKGRDDSPGDSDATEELPSRFDDQGKRRPDAGKDPLADKIDEILTGKGTAGKLFGNFMDGFIGPDGKDKRRRH